MVFRDDLAAARARADALQARVRELEVELARAKGEATGEASETGEASGEGSAARAPYAEMERWLEEARRDAQEASEVLERSSRRITVTSVLSGLWFLVCFAFRAAVLVVGVVLFADGIGEIGDASDYRPPEPLSVSVESLRDRAPEGLVTIRDSVCVLSDLTYLGTLGGESSPDCYFPLVSQPEWAALEEASRGKAGHPSPAPETIRVLVARRCNEIEGEFGPVLAPRGQVPRPCAMTGELAPLASRDVEVRAFVEREFRGVGRGAFLLVGPTATPPSTGFGVFMILAGVVLFVWMALRLVQMVREAREG